MDFSGWIPPEIKVLGLIALAGLLYLAYRVGDSLVAHLSVHWQ